MIRRDLSGVAACCGTLSVEEVELRLKPRNCIGMVAERYNDRGDMVVGYMMYELYRDHLRLIDFATHPDNRRLGIGRALVDKLVYKLCSHRRGFIVVDVPEELTAALLFFRAAGFVAVECGDGAVRMRYTPTAAEWDKWNAGPPPVNRVLPFLAES